MEVILSKNSIIDALKLLIKLYSSPKAVALRFTQKSTVHIVDGKLSLSPCVKKIESVLNLLNSLLLHLSLKVIDKHRIVNLVLVFS